MPADITKTRKDLTIKPAEDGGYFLKDYYGDIMFAGDLVDCLMYMRTALGGSTTGHEHHALLDRLTASPTAQNAMVAMLRKCALQFKYYAANHRAKKTPEADEKARVNAELAVEIEQLIEQRA